MRKQTGRFETVSRWLALALLLANLGGCGNQDDIYPPNAVYRVTVANLTFNQYFSPVGVIIHTAGYKAWEVGQPAAEEIERLAEGGVLASSDDGKWLLTEANKNPAVVMVRVMLDDASSQATGIYGGRRGEVTLSVPPGQDYRLTLATSLTFTNDGFTGVADLAIGQLAIGESLTQYAEAYDAGTEANTETEPTVPGFALIYGKDAIGYDPVRDDVNNFITIHAGVMTHDEPLGDPPDPVKEALRSDSALNKTHRFLQPVAKIIVERVS